MIESYLRDRLRKKEILLMTHIVLGYPSFEDSYSIIKAMVEAGVDIMELQIPFSEPIADGPVILRANQISLENGTTVAQCFDFADKIIKEFDIPFLFMTYYNILFKYGLEAFANNMNKVGIKGAIVPDLPPEEGENYLLAMKENNLAPIFIFSPKTTDDRLKYISSFAKGFVYCVARKGVTGSDTDFTKDITSYIDRCKKATSLPIAVGFGVKNKSDIDFLKAKADIAVIGTQTIRLVENNGVEAVFDFIKNLL